MKSIMLEIIENVNGQSLYPLLKIAIDGFLESRVFDRFVE